MSRKSKFSTREEREQAEIESRQRSAGIRDPFPRGRCPRCGRNAALLRDRSRTLEHSCSAGDLAEYVLGSSEIPLAIDMATGGIVRDPSGEATAGYARLQGLSDLKGQLLRGEQDPTVEELVEALQALMPEGAERRLRSDQIPLLILGLALVADAYPTKAPACRALAVTLDDGRTPIGGVAFGAFYRLHRAEPHT